MMQLDILPFLENIKEKAQVLTLVRQDVQAEIDKYEGMRLVLDSAGQDNEFTRALLLKIDRYLEDLGLIAQKLKQPHLALIKSSPGENPEINRHILAVLQKVNKNKA